MISLWRSALGRSARTISRARRIALRHASLGLGLVLLLPVIAALLLPGVIAPTDPERRAPALQVIDGRPMAPPYPPSSAYVLGTDLRGRDLLSRLIYGARTTILLALLVAALRIGLGAALGWVAAHYPGELRRYILLLANMSASLPSLLFAYIVIVTIGPQRGLPAFVIGLALTGWASWTQLVYAGIVRIQAQPYMEGARVIGTTGRPLWRYYIMPNQLPITTPVAVQEMAAALLILAELGFLGVYVGVNTPISLADLISGEQPQLPFPEWGGMLAGTRLEIFRWYWLILGPALAFLMTILGLHLFADGLRAARDDASPGL